jgi:hypothetical protein
MAEQETVGSYKLFSGTYTIDLAQKPTTKFEVSVGTGASKTAVSFQNTADLGATCAPFDSGSGEPTLHTFSGCFTDSVSSRTLTGAVFADGGMTTEQCADLCESYQFFGLEYGTECFCGNVRSPGSQQVDDTECAMACGGDSSETCGDSNRLSIYENTNWEPTAHPEIEGYDFLGCYTDSTGSRTLSDTFQYSSEMTVEFCASFCDGANYFGLEYFSECFCGASLLESSTLQPETDCSFLCSGNNSQYCGGSNRLSVYAKQT